MPQLLTPDRTGSLQRLSNTMVQMNVSSFGDIRSTIGGQQYLSNTFLQLNSAGTGAGGLDAGSLGANQTWFVHFVFNGSFQLQLLASLSKTAPTGFSLFNFTGWMFYTNSSNQIIQVIQNNSTVTIYANYNQQTPQAIGTGVATPINFDTMASDSFQIVSNPSTNWTARAPFSGLYQIAPLMSISATSQPFNTNTQLWINGSFYNYFIGQDWTQANPSLLGIQLVNLNAGDTFQIDAYSYSPSFTTSGSGISFVSIVCQKTFQF